jgi:CheY-like chemotaxis protein
MNLSKVILIVEDDEEQQKLYRLVLEREGYRVVTRGDGLQGLAWLEQIAPDLIILDINMPYLSGVDLLKRFRATPNGYDVPIIVATANVQISLQDLAPFDIHRLCYKPLLPSTLCEVVRATLLQES